MTKVFKTSLFVACGLLAACGGGSGSETAAPNVNGTGAAGTTLTLLSGAAPSAVSVGGSETALSGGAILTTGGLGTFLLAETVGKRRNNSEAVTIRDANYTFVSNGAVDGQGRLTDGSGAWVRYVPLAEDYEGTRIYEGSYVSDSGTPTAVYLATIGPTADTMPNTGTATYVGEAFGVFESPSSSLSFEGRSRAFADFARGGSVDVIVDGVTATNRATGGAVTPVFSEIRIVDMDVSGTAYEGGTLETLSRIGGQPPVNLFGTGVRASAQGEFYGAPESGQPSATGGVFAISGFTGAMTGAWVGDRKP